MRARHYPDIVQDGATLLSEARAGMDPAARRVFDEALPAT
jgi:hypothetical protein